MLYTLCIAAAVLDVGRLDASETGLVSVVLPPRRKGSGHFVFSTPHPHTKTTQISPTDTQLKTYEYQYKFAPSEGYAYLYEKTEDPQRHSKLLGMQATQDKMHLRGSGRHSLRGLYQSRNHMS
jgi:hypothetical protein